VALHGTRIFVLTKKDAINGRLVSFDGSSETFAKAKTVLAQSDLILSAARGSALVAAHDALYLLGLENGLSVLKRIDYDHPDQIETLALPYAGSITDLTADPLRNGVLLTLTSWIAAPRVLAYTEKKGFVNTALQPDHPADVSMLESKEVLVSSRGAVQVPLSIIARKDLRRDGTAPTLLIAYGAYGYSMLPTFSTRFLPWLNRGGVVAVAHVRGGGEKGEAWHVDGMKEKKQHTVDDFVACANYLTDQRYTARAHLAIEGTSAGGIAVGGFLTQHPELVSAVLYRVGITDLLRSEQRATGAANASEYGSVQIESEFRALLALSPYEHVFDDVKYPAVLLETGANDPRVSSWMLTKMTARLQAAQANQPNHRPTLLRVDFDAGHGIGSDRRQALLQSADEFTFLGWQLGMNGFDAR
jgi:prolyl oligopeptidase